MMKPKRKPSRLKRGSVLAIAVLVLFIVATLTVSVLVLSTNFVRESSHSLRSTLAQGIAESGSDLGLRWLKDLGSPPSSKTAFAPFPANQALSGGFYTVSIVPSADNPQQPLKSYTIVSTGTYLDRSVTVRVLAKESSFGKYAYFTNKETSSVSGGRIWFFTRDRIRGPAHSNNANGTNFQINWTGSTSPIFDSLVTSSGPKIDYAPANPKSESDFSKIYGLGSKGVQTGVDPIPLPQTSDEQKNAAWGAAAGYPSLAGVYAPSGGGIYINGDASVQLKLDTSGNQQFLISQGAVLTTVTVNLANNSTTIQTGNNPPLTRGESGSGVLYCTGNITNLSGTIADNYVSAGQVIKRSAYTIATDVNANKSITVAGSLVQRTKFDPTKAVDDPSNLAAGTLGLIGKDVTVASGAPANMEIDGLVFAPGSQSADGSFGVANFGSKKPTGTLRVVGGIIQDARGAVGTFSGASMSTGYAKDYWYDARMADDPPPYFPTTGTYDTLSWQVQRQ
jgi:Tfp pilus assembly protein PilX